MSRPGVLAVLRRVLVMGGVWTVLTGAEPKGLVLGALAVPAAVWVSLRLLPLRQPLTLRRLPGHGARFIAGSLSGGIDVARRALAPTIRLKPGWIEVPLPRGGGGAAPAIGAELSLMPGTLAAGRRGDRLLVHLIDNDAGFDRAIPGVADELSGLIASGAPATEASR